MSESFLDTVSKKYLFATTLGWSSQTRIDFLIPDFRNYLSTASPIRRRPRRRRATDRTWSLTVFPTIGRLAEIDMIREYRVSTALFDRLATALERRWNGKGYHPKERLAIVLKILSRPGNFWEFADRHGASAASSSRWLRSVSSELLAVFSTEIEWPTIGSDREKSTKAGFEELCGFADVIGALDSCQIVMLERPGAPFSDKYYTRKKRFSMHLQAVVDHTGRFLHVYSGDPGRVHDSLVLQRSGLPDRPYLFSNGYLIADRGYSVSDWLISPFKPAVGLDERAFNECLQNARLRVEHAFGRLKARWQILTQADVDVNLLPDLIKLCCILHNMCEKENVDFLDDLAMEQQIADFRDEAIDAVPDNIIPGQRGTYRRQRLMMQMQLENGSITQAQFDESLRNYELAFSPLRPANRRALDVIPIPMAPLDNNFPPPAPPLDPHIAADIIPVQIPPLFPEDNAVLMDVDEEVPIVNIVQPEAPEIRRGGRSRAQVNYKNIARIGL
jgi:hypothetical protein